jgi:hypothetical protein
MSSAGVLLLSRHVKNYAGWLSVNNSDYLGHSCFVS